MEFVSFLFNNGGVVVVRKGIPSTTGWGMRTPEISLTGARVPVNR